MAPPTMHINHTNFWPNLLSIIETISNADHVAIDLGLIGLKSAPSQLQNPDKLYYEARTKAETIGVFRVGLACSKYDEEAKALHRTLFDTFMLSEFPVTIDEKFKAELAKGIPYWDRKNTLYALSLLQQWDLVEADDRDREKRIRQELTSGLCKRPELMSKYQMKIPSSMSTEEAIIEMKSIYRVVDTHFNDFRVILREPRLLVIDKRGQLDTLGAEERFRKWKPDNKRDGLVGMIGFQYVIEALLGGKFATKIDARFLLSQDAPPAAIAEVTTRLQNAENKLKARRPILVGHNVFLDLCFLWRYFLGGFLFPCDKRIKDARSTYGWYHDDRGFLPSIDEFSVHMHKFFPRIVDTKHLWTVRGGKKRRLKDLYNRYNRSVAPRIVFEAFPGNVVGGAALEGVRNVGAAGRRSLMMAVVFIQASVEAARLDPGLCHAPGPVTGPVSSPDPHPVSATSSGGRSEAEEPKLTPLEEMIRAFAALDTSGSGSTNMVSPVPMPVPEPVPEPKRTKPVFDGSRVPEWDTPFWKKYGNKIPLGSWRVWEFKPYECLSRSDDEEDEPLVDV
ncbi:ribonuclease H-like domain-containing protein [Podospora conica]|nr:ribonuclease H-like domain-containing protein [Schizothecium conicum]